MAALARLGDHRAGGAVLGALRDEDPFVRIAAAAALPCVLEREEALPHLVETLHDADDEVRARVATQLGALGASASAEPLLELVRAEPAGSRAQRAAVEALERLEAGETVRTRRSRLNSPLLLWVAGVVVFGLGVVLAETSGMGLAAGTVGLAGFLLLVGFRVQAARGADQHAYFHPAGDLGGGEAVWLGAAAHDGGWGDVGGADGGGDFGGDVGGL